MFRLAGPNESYSFASLLLICFLDPPPDVKSIIIVSFTRLVAPKDFVDQRPDSSDFFHLDIFLPNRNFFFSSLLRKTIVIMYRSAAPKLSLSISAAQNVRPTLSLKSPGLPRTPISPSAASPTAKRFSSLQVPSYNYSNSCTSKSILKKQPGGHNAVPEKRIQFKGTPTVHCVTPIENPEEYYGNYVKLSREERRWMVRE